MKNTVKLGGRDIQLLPPRSYAAAYDVVIAAQQNEVRAGAAALGLCWQGEGGPKTSYEVAGYDAIKYGGLVMDELVARGLRPMEIRAAGAVAWWVAADQIVSEEEVSAAEGNSVAPAP